MRENKLKMECLGDKCHVCAFSDAQKASRGLSNKPHLQDSLQDSFFFMGNPTSSL